MYPSKIPVLYVLHLLIIGVVIALGIYVGAVVLGEPLSLLLVLALNLLPELPLVPDLSGDESGEGEDPGLYDGSAQAGFISERSA